MPSTSTDGARAGGLLPAGEGKRMFAAFYDLHGDEIFRGLLLTLGDAELARDATQEAMARAWRSWSAVHTYANPAGWVYRVGLNWGRSRYRKLSREVLGKYRDHPQPATEPPDPALRQALAGLSPRHRSVVVLRLYMDWSVEAVAAALGIPEGTVRSRQHAALKQLRQRLKEPR